jgi:hypothetical protein
VVAHATADDQHALVAQRFEQCAELEMRRGIQTRVQRELHDRHVRLRVDQQKRHEHAVVEPALGLGARRHAAGGEQFLHACGERRITRRQVFQLVRMRREAVVVEQQGRRRLRVHGHARLLPVTGDQQYRTRALAKFGGDTAQPGGHAIPGVWRVPFHEKTRPAAVRDVERGQARHWGLPAVESPHDAACAAISCGRPAPGRMPVPCGHQRTTRRPAR